MAFSIYQKNQRKNDARSENMRTSPYSDNLVSKSKEKKAKNSRAASERESNVTHHLGELNSPQQIKIQDNFKR